MAKDRINVSVARLAPQFEVDNPASVQSVALSQLPEYLSALYGEDIPHDERAKQVSGALLTSMAALSTDEETVRLAATDPLHWFPHWLGLIEPMVHDTRRVGGYIRREFIDRENSAPAPERPATNDLTYMVGLFDLASFVVAAELALDHPRFQAKNLLERSRKAVPRGQRLSDRVSAAQRATLDLMARLPIIPADQRSRMAKLTLMGERVIVNTETFIAKTQALFEAHDGE